MRKTFLLLFSISALYANTIIYNANIYTVDEDLPYAQALVIDDEKIVYVGKSTDALALQTEDSTLIDGKNRFIMPGLIDSHTHTALAALLFNTGANLYKAKGKKAILEKIRAYKEMHPGLKLYTGVGFYPYAFGPNGPTKEVLDKIFPDDKAFFISNNGHQAWANSKTLDFLGINKDTPDPLANVHYYVRDTKGNPTGFLIEGEAFWPHLKALGIGKKEAFKKVLRDFLPQFSALGITAVYDASIASLEESAYAALGELEDEKELDLRYLASHFIISNKDAEKASQELIRLQKRYNKELFKVSSIKFINDNSDDDNFGIQFQEEALSKHLMPILKADQDLMIHTSQDTSIHQALNAISTVKQKIPNTASRITLAHVNMVRDADFKRFKELDIVANIQPFDAQGGGYYEYRYMLYEDEWENKLARYRHFFDEGVRVSSSSDYPACNKPLQECSPFHGIQIGMTRQKIGAIADEEILASTDERLSLEQSIRAYTVNGAYQLHLEDTIGSLEVGKEADLIILDRNPFETKTEELHTIKVLQTFLKGKSIYEKY